MSDKRTKQTPVMPVPSQAEIPSTADARPVSEDVTR
jgi:hypothetical protein